MRVWRWAGVAAVVLLATGAARADQFKLKIIAITDLHGNLQPPGKYQANAQSPRVDVGGADELAGYIEHLESENPYHVVVSAGDVIGASPLASGLFHDEGTIEAMNLLGLQFSAVGNHEFDHGKQELLRMQYGGCSKADENTCKGTAAGMPAPFEGAKFKYLAANVVDTDTGKTIFPGYAIAKFDGVRVAFIGLTLQATPTLLTKSEAAGLRFEDEAGTINAIVRELRKKGIQCFVVLIHQGGQQSTRGIADINGCEGGLQGSAIREITSKLDDSVSLVISGHLHTAYICQLPNSTGRKISVTSAAAFGRLVTEIDVTIDRKTKKSVNVTAQNIVVDRTNPAIRADGRIRSLVDKYAELAGPIANRVVGEVAQDITIERNPAGESALGDVVADAALEATQDAKSGGAQVAFLNPGGIRLGLFYNSNTAGVANGKVTYGKLYTVLPFGDTLETMTLTGTQIKTLLETQFGKCSADTLGSDGSVPATERVLQVSKGFTYTWDESRAACDKVEPGSIQIGGVPVAATGTYRVAVNSFLAEGANQLSVFANGKDRVEGPVALDALVAYFAKHGLVAQGARDRIHVVK